MKSIIKNLLLAAAAVLLTCSFIEMPVPNAMNNTAGIAPVGGAWVLFAGKNGGEITQQEMQGQTTLGVDGCARGSRIFTFSLEVRKNGKTSTYETKSNVLTNEMLTALRTLTPGDQFEFKNMKAYLPNGKDVVDVRGNAFIVAAKKA